MSPCIGKIRNFHSLLLRSGNGTGRPHENLLSSRFAGMKGSILEDTRTAAILLPQMAGQVAKKCLSYSTIPQLFLKAQTWGNLLFVIETL